MNDRRLLELAAKAAGYKWRYENDGQMSIFMFDRHWVFWTPLLDDGDALRLAAKLTLDVSWDRASGYVDAFCAADVPARPATRELYYRDPLAGIRRAIVRAAAAIGATL